MGSRSQSAPSQSNKATRSSRKSLTDSTNHETSQVLGFSKSVKGESKEPDMSRELYSVPMSENFENMADHLKQHTPGDTFQYVSVMGREEESRDSRLARLRSYTSTYGKQAKPEMRINGVILDEVEGTLLVENLKDYVDQDRLSRTESRQNKRFKPLVQESFKKPYLQISRITGEYVPLMSSNYDFTDLHFALEDNRLLDNKVCTQSSQIPTNANGIFELSCDYCISTKDLSQLSLKYYLARPIMKEGFQWGAVSLTIRATEADTPFIAPKVEAMAIVRTPFTTLEEQVRNPDHANVVFTSGQISQLRELYRAGEVADIDEPKKERTKANSYSKSTIRGASAVKGTKGPEHLSAQPGWEHLKDMRKPRLPEGEASVSALSDSTEEVGGPTLGLTKAEYEAQQEAMRTKFVDQLGEPKEDEPRKTSTELTRTAPKEVVPVKKSLRFEEPSKERSPDTSSMYLFD